MKVICLASAKGGVGKSTLAVNIACAMLEDGNSVALLDLDPQGSALLWHQLRSERGSGAVEPAVREVAVEVLVSELRRLGAQQTDYVILDMPGYSSDALSRAFRHCDLVLVPSRASIIDIAPATETIEAAIRMGKTFCYLMNFVRGSDKTMFNGVKQQLEGAGLLVCPVAVPDSEAFPLAFMNGKSVTEYEPKGKAAKEVRWLWRFLKGLV
ncbi:MAG: AAA family ATPase [Hyphomicrobiaceae bacterium]